MRLSIEHTTRVEYQTAVTDGVMLARLGPLSDVTQTCEGFSLIAKPDASIRAFPDAFGNVTHLVTVPDAHSTLEITATSRVSTLLVDPELTGSEHSAPLSLADRYDYLRPTGLVPVDDGLAQMAQPFRTDDPDRLFESIRQLMNAVHEHFVYERLVTNVGTTAAEALELGRGVCQDYTHVLIGLCRANGIPARYASGYLVGPQAGAPSGAGYPPGVASHAWVEAWTPTHGWRGFDPTNNTVVATSHVKMAIGRDYADVPPTRGTSRGPSDSNNERLYVQIKVHQIEDDAG